MTSAKTVLRPALAFLSLFSLTIALISFVPVSVGAQVRRDRPATRESIETTTGEKAVESLKQSGEYESLKDAFREATASGGEGAESLLPGGSYEEVGLVSSNGTAFDFFGSSVAVSGDTAVIGTGDLFTSGDNRNSAYVFVRSGTSWSLQTELLASDRATGDHFGVSVAVSGDTIVVGAPADNIGAASDQGSAYVFTRSGTVWTEQAKLVASDGGVEDFFGFRVAISGDTVLVGVPFDNLFYEPGSAYIFTRSGGVWSEQQKLSASDGAGMGSDGFGWSAALSGDTAIVGAQTANPNGAAYVFTRSGTVWTEQAKLVAPDGAPGDFFGSSVDLSGDTVIIGAYNATVGTNTQQGAAYIFTRSGTTWSQQARLTASDGAEFDLAGSGVAISGDTAVVGASADDVGSNANQGSAYVFTRSGSAWTEQTKLTASDGAANDVFGNAVALSGDTAVVGIYQDSVGPNFAQGSAKVFQTRMSIDKKTATDRAEGDAFGQSVALSGDTAVVGASGDDIGGNVDQGSAYVFVREDGRWKVQAKLTASDGASGDIFGLSVAISGDTVVVGAEYDDVGANADHGSAYVFTRSGNIWTQEAKLTATDGAANDHFGSSVAVSDDTAVIGADSDDVGTNDYQGSAYVFTRSGTTWTQQAKLTAADGAESDFLGESVAVSGDTVVAGANGDDSYQGSAYVFTRSGTTWTQQAKLTAADESDFAWFGRSVAISGDTVVAGAFGDNSYQGSAYVFTRSGTTWTQQAKLVAPDRADYDSFGFSVAVSGETAVIGADRDDSFAGGEQGSAYIFTRSGTNWSFQRKLVAPDGGASDYFGQTVAVSGETALVGAPFDRFGSSGSGEGSVYMFYWGPPGPTAAGSKLSGRVLEPSGRGLRNATVVLTDSSGNTQTAQTGTFGNFSFSDLPSGETYVLSVKSKRFVFTPEAVSLFSDLEGLVIRASGGNRR